MLQNPRGRKTISLNGNFRAIVDPYDNGYYDYRYQRQTTEGYFRARKPTAKSDRIEYDFDTSGVLSVPGDWNSQRAELFFYEGTVWYKRDFVCVRTPGARFFVYFGAANYRATVYLNGHQVGEHEGGFTPFAFEVTSFLTEGHNFLIVRVDNRRQRDGVPALNTDWWNYGGLTRDVLLVETPETLLEDYWLGLAPDRDDEITGFIKLAGPRLEQNVTIRLPEAGIERTFRTDASGLAHVSMRGGVQLWTPEAPRLYAVEIASETDRIRDRIGFRRVAVRKTDILLNGRPLFLRGISVHEQAPRREGRAFGEEDARVLLGWAKELGANFVRLAHYPHDEHTVRLADEMGLLVWSEIPVYWTIDWNDAATLGKAKRQLTEMIERDKNRASVIIWSIGNETPVGEPRLRFMTELATLARRLDPSRLVSAALEKRALDRGTQIIDDPLGEWLDVIGCNEYVGWYEGLADDADDMVWQSVYDKPLIMTELGAGALQGHHGDALTRWTEEFQANVYEHQIAMLRRIPFLRGLTPWILADFRSPRRPLPFIQDYWNRKGLVSDRGEKKAAFFVLQHYYRERARAG